MLKWDYTLYLVTDRSYIGGRNLEDCVEEAIVGGTTMIQLREKTASSLDFYNLAARIKDITVKYHVPLIINDRLDIAMAIDADGLHLGQDDLPIEIARKHFGEDKIIGISVSTTEEAVLAEKSGADYLGAGAMFPTGTKTDAKLVSLPELRLIKGSVSIPVVAIGGINENNAYDIFSTGIDGLSIVSAILAKENIREASSTIKSKIIGS